MSTIEERLSTNARILSALVGDYISAGRSDELWEIERKARKGLPRAEQARQMVAMANARLSNPPVSKRRAAA